MIGAAVGIGEAASRAYRVCAASPWCLLGYCWPETVSYDSTPAHRDSALVRRVATDGHAACDCRAGSRRRAWLCGADLDPTAAQDVQTCAVEDASGTARPARHGCSCSDEIGNTVRDADIWAKRSGPRWPRLWSRSPRSSESGFALGEPRCVRSSEQARTRFRQGTLSGLQVVRFFFIRGHTCCFQYRIASSFRSRSRGVGF